MPFAFLDARNAPGIDMVVDFASIMMKSSHSSKRILIRVIVSGCILSVGLMRMMMCGLTS